MARGRKTGARFAELILAGLLVFVFVVAGLYVYYNYIQPAGFQQVQLPQPPAAQVQPPAAGIPFCQTGGSVQLTLNSLWDYDDSDIDGWGTAKIYTMDGRFITNLADDTATTFQITPTDSCRVMLAVKYTGASTPAFVNPQKTLAANPAMTDTDVKDVDNDGFMERVFYIDFSKLPNFMQPLLGGETYKIATLILYLTKTTSSGLSLVKVADITGVSTTAYNFYTASFYISGLPEGYSLKLVYIKITLPNAANATYADPANGYIQLRQVTVGGNDYVYSFGTDSIRQTTSTYAYDTWLVDLSGKGVTSTNQPEQGLLFVTKRGYAQNWLALSLQFYAKFPSTGQKIIPTVTLTFVKPDGTTFTLSQTVSMLS
jgi:hypothetical protein